MSYLSTKISSSPKIFQSEDPQVLLILGMYHLVNCVFEMQPYSYGQLVSNNLHQKFPFSAAFLNINAIQNLCNSTKTITAEPPNQAVN